MQIQRFHCSERNAILLCEPLPDAFSRFAHYRLFESILQLQIRTHRHSVREGFNIQPPQSKLGLIKEAADHGNGPEVEMYQTAPREISDELQRAKH